MLAVCDANEEINFGLSQLLELRHNFEQLGNDKTRLLGLEADTIKRLKRHISLITITSLQVLTFTDPLLV